MLGTWLVEHNIITEDELTRALKSQLSGGGRLGDILIASGATTPLKLYQAIATHYQLPFMDLLKEGWDKQDMHVDYLHDYIDLRLLPIGKVPGTGVMRIATSEPMDPKVKQFCYARYPKGIEMVVTSPFDIRRTIEQQFSHTITDESLFRLADLMPEHSARYRLSPVQITILLLLLAAFAASNYTHSYETAAISLLTAHLLYLITLSFKMLIFCAGLRPTHYTEPVAPLLDKDLPNFTLLVPLYKEANMVANLMQSLAAIDYPPQKLDIKLILEADDQETYMAAIQLKPSYQFDIIRVPPSEPRTKPKACNYALAFAKGDIITIFDAEDIPDPNQLRKVAHMFDAAPTDVTTIQAKLRYYNADKNLLTRFFDIEYTILFEHLLKGLERLGMPIPLGGTSNHINAQRFREMGDWDPYNVTEDADLGIRFASAGYKTQMVDSTTMEEAPPHLGGWMRQRSRWIKGHIQTWLVHSRSPLKLLRTTGIRGFIGFTLFLGLPYFLYLTALPILALSLLWVYYDMFDDILPQALSALMAFNFMMFLAVNWLQAWWAYRREKKNRLAWLAIALFPTYWILHIFTSFKSLWQLLFNPFYWEKTEHGE